MTKQVLNPDRIVKATIELIEADAPITFANVARHLDIKSQALYPYFADQQALRYAVMASLLTQLNEAIRRDLFGKSGRDAVMQIALTCRQLGIDHPQLARFITTLPRVEQDDAALSEAFNELYTMMTTLVGQLVRNERVQLLGSRFIRNIIIGEVTNIASGWFANPDLTRTDSFVWMINHGIDDLVAEDQKTASSH